MPVAGNKLSAVYVAHATRQATVGSDAATPAAVQCIAVAMQYMRVQWPDRVLGCLTSLLRTIYDHLGGAGLNRPGFQQSL